MKRIDALHKMQSFIGRKDIAYHLGGTTDTEKDCFQAAVCDAYGLVRHRPGFNHGPWATVSDDLNCNSAIEDSEHRQELFVPVSEDELNIGDLIMYSTIRLPHHPLPFIGHVQMVVRKPPGWTRKTGFSALDIVHCHGPEGRRPAVTIGRGDACDHHDQQWNQPQWLTRMVRVKGSG